MFQSLAGDADTTVAEAPETTAMKLKTRLQKESKHILSSDSVAASSRMIIYLITYPDRRDSPICHRLFTGEIANKQSMTLQSSK